MFSITSVPQYTKCNFIWDKHVKIYGNVKQQVCGVAIEQQRFTRLLLHSFHSIIIYFCQLYGASLVTLDF